MPNTQKVLIQYYTSNRGEIPAKKFIDSLRDKQKAKIFRIFLYIQDYGLIASIPHIKKLTGTPLWEIRILGSDNIRILYSTILNGSILILHGFIKKSQKTPTKELDIALKRFNDWILRNK